VSLQRRLDGLRTAAHEAVSREDFQDVGRRCRAILIDLASLVYTPEMLPPSETDHPGAADAETRLAYATAALIGRHGHEHRRALIRDACGLADTITRSSSARHVDALAAVQATVLLVGTFEQAIGTP
jgi:hypothetical protein